MSRWAIAGVVAVVVVVVIVVVVVVSTRRAPTGVRVRVSSGSAPRAPDAVFTVDSAGRFPGDPGWVDEGATVDV